MADNTALPGIEFAIGYLALTPAEADKLRSAARANIAALQQHVDRYIAELEAALREAIEGWEDGANYKGEYLRKKHGDAEGITQAKAVLRKSTPVI